MRNEKWTGTILCITLSLMAQEPIREVERAFCHEIERVVLLAQREGSIQPHVPAMFVSQTLLGTYRDLLLEGRTDLPSMKRAVPQMLIRS